MGRDLYKDETLAIPKGVSVDIKARAVTVTGPRGVLKQSLRHIDLEIKKQGNVIKFIVWHGSRLHNACLRTVHSIINNMIVGVTQGFRYKMRLVYAHFPININLSENGGVVEIRNFLGERITRVIKCLPGVTVSMSANVKDELIIEGNSLENVSQSAANIKQICNVRNKDIRKFLDGIYVSERGNITELE
ncbi:60S ribosomal protein L9 [Schizosaccharomyces cryophilus OY26]|uniref:60S ribosomal protein L9 n=1 Tax=Schizosaccharomyces cryophilus (strain OY26 / ATCC MYA-4695 / CBS 11777 / NBRC 106824 / NRRL Y48691) TaxID=653667 RepID=S9XCL3_SCHCR|nr:60S ribosomal protein L9 [Schizosaccharomyces cryophilus OY26]EPY51596.1 60S ribosomal protein L9 [Schizosaccharomyces cryophilus OY26]